MYNISTALEPTVSDASSSASSTMGNNISLTSDVPRLHYKNIYLTSYNIQLVNWIIGTITNKRKPLNWYLLNLAYPDSELVKLSTEYRRIDLLKYIYKGLSFTKFEILITWMNDNSCRKCKFGGHGKIKRRGIPPREMIIHQPTCKCIEYLAHFKIKFNEVENCFNCL